MHNDAMYVHAFTVPLTATALRPVAFATALGATIEYPISPLAKRFCICDESKPNTVGVSVNLLNQDKCGDKLFYCGY